MQDYTAAIIGCGRMSRGHAGAYQAVGIPIVGAADIAEEGLQRAREHFGSPQTYTDYREMLAETRPDFVSVVTAEMAHCEAVVAAAEAGVKAIMCEKPMAMDLAEGKEMLRACRENDVVLTISHQRQYGAQYVAARELVESGAIGDVRFVEAYAMAPSIHTDGTHTIHMLRSLLGDPKVARVIAQIDGNSDYEYFGHRCDHAGNAFLSFDDGRYAYLTWGLAAPGSNARLHPAWDFDTQSYHAFVVHGEHGRVELDGDLYETPEGKTCPGGLRLCVGTDIQEIDYAWPGEGHIALELRDLVRSVETGAEHPLSGENGYAALEVVMGIYESSRRRGAVEFPVDATDNAFLEMCASGVFPSGQ